MTTIRLSHNEKYRRWFRSGNIFVLGRAFYATSMMEERELADYFAGILNETSFEKRLKLLSGQFAVVIEQDREVYLAVDIIRSFPLFIRESNNGVEISDAIDTDGCHWDEAQINYFKKLYYTVGNDTLLREWKQLQAGDYAVISKDSRAIKIKPYFLHEKVELFSGKKEEIIKDLEQDFIHKIKAYTGGRPILIPLSGGYDSRYLLAMLKEHNVANVSCFTYGRKTSYEVQTARKVCEKLKVEWHFVEYTDILMQLFFSDEWKNYSAGYHQFTSLPQEQDFFALYYLRKNNLLPDNAVILNGYIQGTTSGCMIIPERNFDLKEFIKYKYGIRCELTGYSNSWDGFNSWLIRNRSGKFSIGSIKAYEYFGLDFYLPFLDTKWVKFWYSLPLEDRMQQRFYKDYLFSGIFRKYAIDFKKPFFNDVDKLQSLKQSVKKFLPQFIIDYIQATNNKKINRDSNNTIFLYNAIHEQLEKKPVLKDFNLNNIHAGYFLQELKKNYLL